MARANKPITVKSTTPKLSVADKKQQQYREAMSARNAARYDIRATESQLSHFKARIAESQNRIGVLEYLFSGLRTSEPVVERFLMDAIEEENEAVKSLNGESKGYRDSLTDHRKRYAKAEKLLTAIIENGPDLQEIFDEMDADDDFSDNKSRSAGR